MNEEKDLIYLTHILKCIEILQVYTAIEQEDFLNNVFIQDAVLRRLQIMAESTQRLSDQLKSQSYNIDWKALSGFRNILVHDYLDGINLERVWNAIEHDLPVLRKQVEFMLQNFRKGDK